MRTFIGTSGYAYKPWKGKFYPEDLPDDRMLEFYSSRLGAVEINNTFYRMPTEKVLATWAAQVPESFCFVLKASRRITHQGRLKPETVADSVEFLFAQAATLGERLGPVLFQLPPFAKQNLERLEAFLRLLPEGRRAAFEFRNVSWFEEPTYALLRKYNSALCYSDKEMKEDPPFVSTADWGYLRLRGEAYDDAALAAWAERIAKQGWSDAFVFFKHEDGATGPALAERFKEFVT